MKHRTRPTSSTALVPNVRWSCLRGKRDHAAWLQRSRSVPLLHSWNERPLPSAERSSAAVAKAAIERLKLTRPHRSAHIDPRSANWPRTEAWRTSWPADSNCIGRHSRLTGGSSMLVRATGATTCHTRPSPAWLGLRRKGSGRPGHSGASPAGDQRAKAQRHQCQAAGLGNDCDVVDVEA